MTGRVLIFVLLLAVTGPGQQKHDDLQYTKEGRMILPDNYREWIFLSSGLGTGYGVKGPVDANGNPFFDNVFVNPAAYRQFLQNGKWPDRTVLILEGRTSDSQVSINRSGSVQTNVAYVEAHVKDAARFPAGWAFFEFRKSEPASPLARTFNCYVCHEKSGAVDTTFIQFYPTLKEVAKKKGTYSER